MAVDDLDLHHAVRCRRLNSLAETARFHGRDERIAVRAMRGLAGFYSAVIRNADASLATSDV